MLGRKMLNRGGAAALALALCFLLTVLDPQNADASDRRRGFAIGTGIIGGIIAGQIISDSAAAKPQRSQAAPSYSRSRSSRSRKSRATARARPAQPAAVSPAAANQQLPPDPAVTAPPNAMPISTPAEIVSAQQHLHYMGYDVPQATGTLDLKTKIAVMQFQESIGAEATGVLTTEQLRALFAKVAERHAAGGR